MRAEQLLDFFFSIFNAQPLQHKDRFADFILSSAVELFLGDQVGEFSNQASDNLSVFTRTQIDAHQGALASHQRVPAAEQDAVHDVHGFRYCVDTEWVSVCECAWREEVGL